MIALKWVGKPGQEVIVVAQTSGNTLVSRTLITRQKNEQIATCNPDQKV